MKRHCLLFLFCCISMTALSASGIDSLRNLLQSPLPDSLRLRVLNELSFRTSNSNLYLSLTYADEGLQLAEALNDRDQKRQIIHLMGIAHYRLGNYDKTFSFFRQVLRMFEDDDDLPGIGRMYNNLGILYSKLEQHDLSLHHYEKALAIKRKLKDSSDVTSTLSNIGLLYLQQQKYAEAYQHFTQSLAMDEKLNNAEGIVYTSENLGRLYARKQQYDSALYFYAKSLRMLKEGEGDYERSTILNSISQVYLQMNQPGQAIQHFTSAVEYGRKVEARTILQESYKGLSEAYAQLNDFKRAYRYHQQYNQLKDSIFNEENLKKISDIESNYQIQKREKEIEILRKDAQISSLNLSQKQMINYYLYSGLFLFFGLILFLFRQYKTKKNSNTKLEKQNLVISARNAEMTSSINYAKTIQEAILPQESRLQLYFPDSFALAQARDIVNGDFYWVYPKEDVVLLAVVDCTGHGVPGAFMTVMANSLLNQVIIDSQIYAPASILDQLHQRMEQSLYAQKGLQLSKDGLDLVICRIDKKARQISYASAKRPVYYIRESRLQILKGNKSTLGGPLSIMNDPFQEFSFPYEPESCLYLFTDGITDQFGERTNKKFMHWRLKELLVQMHQLPMLEQKHHLQEAFRQWQGNIEQTDDRLILGLRL